MEKQQSRNKTVRKRKKGDYSKMIVSFVIVANVIFTALVLITFWKTGMEPQALIAAWFGFTTIELWSLAGITKKKEETKQKEIRYGDDCNVGEDFNNYG